MPVAFREPVMDFIADETAIITAQVKDWWVLKEAFIFSYKVQQMAEPSKIADLAFAVVSRQYDQALQTGSVPSLEQSNLDVDDSVTVSMPNILFLAVFSSLDKVAYWAEAEATPEAVKDQERPEDLLAGATHLLDSYRVFQPQAAAISKTYATA